MNIDPKKIDDNKIDDIQVHRDNDHIIIKLPERIYNNNMRNSGSVRIIDNDIVYYLYNTNKSIINNNNIIFLYVFSMIIIIFISIITMFLGKYL